MSIDIDKYIEDFKGEFKDFKSFKDPGDKYYDDEDYKCKNSEELKKALQNDEKADAVIDKLQGSGESLLAQSELISFRKLNDDLKDTAKEEVINILENILSLSSFEGAESTFEQWKGILEENNEGKKIDLPKKWPLLTFPFFIVNPHVFSFIKPTVVKFALEEIINSDIKYKSKKEYKSFQNYQEYHNELSKIHNRLKEKLDSRDWLDTNTFLYRVKENKDSKNSEYNNSTAKSNDKTSLKPFIILSGISGTGKTQLAKAIALSQVDDEDSGDSS